MKPYLHGTEIPLSKDSILKFLNIQSFIFIRQFQRGYAHNLDFVATSSNTPTFINQIILNDRFGNLALPKYKAKILGSCLKQWHLLDKGIRISSFHHLNKKLSSFFDFYNDLYFCKNIDGLMMDLAYEDKCDDDWRLFIDLSKTSLKAVLLLNGNTHSFIPVAHSVQLKKTYETIPCR